VERGGGGRTSELQPRKNAVYRAVQVGLLGHGHQRALHVADGFQTQTAALGVVSAARRL
jgi:hypothetical protein